MGEDKGETHLQKPKMGEEKLFLFKDGQPITEK